jgi:FkbM family methyltransferase
MSAPYTPNRLVPPPWANFVARRRRSWVLRNFAGLCRRYLSMFGNLNYDMHTNGEAFVLQRVAKFRPEILFDVGANVGKWSITAKSYCPDAEIHAFEVAPPTFRALSANLKRLNGAHCVNLGLSDVPGPVTIHHYPAAPSLTTCLVYPHPYSSTEVAGELTTGDAYAAAHGIEHIDLLKIDVEGMEDRVLRGFGSLLQHRAIRLVQFEYGRVNILSRFLLRDFYEFFRQYGYVVGKIYPNYVEFREYALSDEDFLGPNYLACREEDTQYLRALSGTVERTLAKARHGRGS